MDPIDNESEMKDLLSSAEDVRDVIGVKNIYSYQLINRDGEAVPEDFDVEAMEDGDYLDYYYHTNADIYFIDDESFNKLLKKENISIDGVTSGAKPAVIFNTGTYYTGDENGNLKKVEYKFTDEDKIPIRFTVNWSNEFSVPGLSIVNQVVDEN
jgi:hypothetical protein